MYAGLKRSFLSPSLSKNIFNVPIRSRSVKPLSHTTPAQPRHMVTCTETHTDTDTDADTDTHSHTHAGTPAMGLADSSARQIRRAGQKLAFYLMELRQVCPVDSLIPEDSVNGEVLGRLEALLC